MLYQGNRKKSTKYYLKSTKLQNLHSSHWFGYIIKPQLQGLLSSSLFFPYERICIIHLTQAYCTFFVCDSSTNLTTTTALLGFFFISIKGNAEVLMQKFNSQMSLFEVKMEYGKCSVKQNAPGLMAAPAKHTRIMAIYTYILKILRN